ncbi:MAG: hypothetical protein AAGA48_39415 [Myxococcota bacterium]
MGESDSGSPISAAAILIVVAAFLCGGVPALVICGGMGASFWDILGTFIGQ